MCAKDQYLHNNGTQALIAQATKSSARFTQHIVRFAHGRSPLEDQNAINLFDNGISHFHCLDFGLHLTWTLDARARINLNCRSQRILVAVDPACHRGWGIYCALTWLHNTYTSGLRVKSAWSCIARPPWPIIVICYQKRWLPLAVSERKSKRCSWPTQVQRETISWVGPSFAGNRRANIIIQLDGGNQTARGKKETCRVLSNADFCKWIYCADALLCRFLHDLFA